MESGGFAITLVVVAVSITTNIALAIAWVRSTLALRQAQREARGLPDADLQRIEQLEGTLDTLVGQLDQLASGQEFLQRVVTERLGNVQAPPARLPSPPEITPH